MRATPATDARALLRSLFDAAVAAADPLRLLPGRLPPPPLGRTVVVGAGKAAARMARAVDLEWRGPLEGLVVTRYGHGEPCERIEVLEAAHPLPDAAGQAAAGRVLDLVRGLEAQDLVICLLSGGGSALLEALPPELTLDDVREVSRALLRSGADITEINCVRKHLSLVKGGRLAEAARPARVVTYAISDVPGDDPSVIASGPTVPDPTTFADALAVLRRYGIAGPLPVLRYLLAGAGERRAREDQSGGWGGARGDGGRRRPAAGSVPGETPKPGDPVFAGNEVVVLATARDAIDAAAEAARVAGVEPVVLGYDLEGEARELGRAHAAVALACAVGRGPAVPPCVLLSGGETTVTVKGGGRGGRNGEYLLGLALALDGAPGVYALAADTDGVDGTEDNAGAFLLPDTLRAAAAAGVEPTAALAANDAYAVFAAAAALLVTGPTRTNVNDLRAVLVLPPGGP